MIPPNPGRPALFELEELIMNQKSLAVWLKVILIGVGLCGLVVFFVIFPAYGRSLAEEAPEFENRYWPWLVFLWISAVPCYAALVFGWFIACNIGRDRSFSEENAKHLRVISWLAAGDAAFFFTGNIVLLFLDMSHPGVTLASLIVVFGGVAVTVAAAILSHLVRKAAALQEQSDLTI